MKDASDDTTYIFGHVELEQARFNYSGEMGIDFQNEIDAWSKMEVIFRQQIKQLKDKKLKRSSARKDFKLKDLSSLVYSFREKIE